MRPLAPLLYLDINHYIKLARVAGGKSTPAGYERLFHEVKRAVTQERVVVVLSSEHPYEMLGIKDPKQRAAVAAVMEEVAKFRYLLGGPELAQLEFEAGIAAGFKERLPEIPYPLVRQTVLWAHGRKGGLTVRDSAGNDVTEQARQEVGPGKFDRMVRWGELELERLILRGPTDEELPDLIARGWDGPSALASRESRLVSSSLDHPTVDVGPGLSFSWCRWQRHGACCQRHPGFWLVAVVIAYGACRVVL